jgi:ribonuclease D
MIAWISREDMAVLPIGRYEGDVCLAATPEELALAREDLRSERVVGFDTETRPAFRKGESYLPCLVQAATARAVYIFQLSYEPAHAVLAELLEDARTVKAGVALAHDLRTLAQVFPFERRNIVDLGVIARRAGLEQTGVRNLAGIFLGLRMPKGSRTSNWAARKLTPAQIAYAASDAWACRELFLRFEAEGLLQQQSAPAGVAADGV